VAVTLPLIEPLLDAVRSYLLSDLPAKLLAVSADIGDGLELPMFDAESVYTVDKVVLTAYPTLEIMPGTSREMRRISTNPTVYDFDHQMVCAVSVAGMEEEPIARQLYRYLRGIAELLEEDTSLGGYALDTMLTEINFMPTGGSAGSVFNKSGWIAATVRTREGY
jgi:hypothetical protein